MLRQLAADGLTIAEAEAKFGLAAGDLAMILSRRPRSAQAWRRGETLHIVGSLSRKGATLAEAAAALETPPEHLKAEIEADTELRSAWRRGRAEIREDVRKALLTAIEAGRTGPLNRFLDELAREEAPEVKIDFQALAQKDLATILGVTRATLHNWAKEDPPLPRNADGSYPATDVIRWWHRREVSRLGNAAIGAADSEEDLRRERIEKLRIDNAARRGELLDRRLVVAGFVARAQQLVAWLAGKPASLAQVLQGQPPARMADSLGQEFDSLRRLMMEPPEVLRLAGQAGELLRQLLKALEPTETEAA